MSVIITIKRRKDRQIQSAMNLANRDSMTGLYNHVAYERLVNKTLEFTAEGPEETEEVLRAFREGRKTRCESTTGHWKRPVE